VGGWGKKTKRIRTKGNRKWFGIKRNPLLKLKEREKKRRRKIVVN
jgi:hypothetical protein